MAPFRMASEQKGAEPGRDGCSSGGRVWAKQLLEAPRGSSTSQRVAVPFAWEFADPATYARALVWTGPAYEAIQAVGEEEFLRPARDEAVREPVRDGLAPAGRDRGRWLPRTGPGH